MIPGWFVDLVIGLIFVFVMAMAKAAKRSDDLSELERRERFTVVHGSRVELHQRPFDWQRDDRSIA